MSRAPAYEDKNFSKPLWKKLASEHKIESTHFVITLDCDDTIVQYSPTLAKCLYKAQQTLISQGIANSLPSTPTSFVDKTYEQTLAEAFTAQYQKEGKLHYQEQWQKFKDYPKHPAIHGAIDLFRKILDANIKIAIISNDKTSAVWRKLLQHVFPNNPSNNQLVENLAVNVTRIISTLIHLETKTLSVEQCMWRQVIIDFVKSNHLVILGYDLAKPKPDISLGIKALEMLKIAPTDRITICHLGDGMISDHLFAKNLDSHLKTLNSLSQCHFIYFGLQFDYKSGEAIVSEQHLQPGKECDVTFGYGGFGSIIKHFLNPALINIDDSTLAIAKKSLKSPTASNKTNRNYNKLSFFSKPNVKKINFLIAIGLSIVILLKIFKKNSSSTHENLFHGLK